jgi:hypothetical protein
MDGWNLCDQFLILSVIFAWIKDLKNLKNVF